MNKEKLYTVKELAKLKKVSVRRVQAEIKQGHYTNAIPPHGWLIPQRDVDANIRGEIIDRRRKSKKA